LRSSSVEQNEDNTNISHSHIMAHTFSHYAALQVDFGPLYWPSGEILTPSTPRKSPNSFLDLPREVRDQIYKELIRPGQGHRYGCENPYRYHGTGMQAHFNALGCTNVLLLNKTIYSEAIDIVHQLPAGLSCQNGGGRIFRHPRNQGKPNFFNSYASSSSIDIDAGMSELEFIKLRSVNISIRYGRGAYNDAAEDLRAINQVLYKSRNLKEIHLTIGPAGATKPFRYRRVGIFVSEETVASIRRHAKQLIENCIELSIHLKASSHIVFDDMHSKKNVIHFDHYNDRIASYINRHPRLVASNEKLELNVFYRSRTKTPLRPFLQPECKHCYALFATPDDLQAHLRFHSWHNVPFRTKAYNVLARLAKTGGDRHACLVCARSFRSAVTLDEHCGKLGHHRSRDQGIVPRWVEDNGWFSIAVWKKNWSENDDNPWTGERA
jgi:hypothetical protein